jgi:hypothetical protein
VAVTVGLIVGLPADDPAGFTETLDFVLEEAPGAQVQVFPLALLPGTDLRGRAEFLGLEYLRRPPYTVRRTRGFGPEDLDRAFDRFEEVTDLELDPLGEPSLAGCWEGNAEGAPYVSGVRLDARRAPADWVERVAPRAARNLTVRIDGWRETIAAEVAALARRLPHGVLTLVLEDEPGWPAERLAALLWEVGTGDHYLDRYFSHLYGLGARLVPRLVVLMPEGHPGATLQWVEAISRRADLVWRVEAQPGWERTAARRARQGDWVRVSGEVSEESALALFAELGEEAAYVLFACPRAEELRDRALGRRGFRAAEHRLRCL